MQIRTDGRQLEDKHNLHTLLASQTKWVSDRVYDPSSLIQPQADQFSRTHAVLQQALRWVFQQAMLLWL